MNKTSEGTEGKEADAMPVSPEHNVIHFPYLGLSCIQSKMGTFMDKAAWKYFALFLEVRLRQQGLPSFLA